MITELYTFSPSSYVVAEEWNGNFRVLYNTTLAHMEAIVLSMTIEERRNPKVLNPRRKFRIAKGAGVDISEVNRFIKQFEQSQKMMKQFTGKKGRGLFGGFPGMGGGKGRFPF
jgi:signal recognition particle subunit SRP54